jgi:hypothetical protein
VAGERPQHERDQHHPGQERGGDPDVDEREQRDAAQRRRHRGHDGDRARPRVGGVDRVAGDPADQIARVEPARAPRPDGEHVLDEPPAQPGGGAGHARGDREGVPHLGGHARRDEQADERDPPRLVPAGHDGVQRPPEHGRQGERARRADQRR